MPHRLSPMIDEAARSLTAAFRHHWPANVRKEQAEANAITHLGIALARADFHVYAEIPENGGGRVDLFAARRADRIAVAVEGKRLWNTGGAESMAIDHQRLLKLRLATKERHPAGYDCFGILLATTWGAGVQPWWADPERPELPGGCREPRGWQRLRTALGTAARIETHPLGRPDHHLLYAVYACDSWFT